MYRVACPLLPWRVYTLLVYLSAHSTLYTKYNVLTVVSQVSAHVAVLPMLMESAHFWVSAQATLRLAQ